MCRFLVNVVDPKLDIGVPFAKGIHIIVLNLEEVNFPVAVGVWAGWVWNFTRIADAKFVFIALDTGTVFRIVV